jgi:Family of unknown function (DUF5309)
MAVDAKTGLTYGDPVIKEDLQDAYVMISPEECPFQTAIGRKDVTNTLFDWPVVELAATNPNNRRLEGDDNLVADDVTRPLRMQNYTQIGTKVVSVSHTEEAVDAAAENIQRIAKQITIKLKELKRDTEVQLLQNIAANPGATGVARVSAGFGAWLITNTIRGAGGVNPTLSNGTSGYPNAAAVPGAPAPLLETDFNDVISQIWNEGGTPSIALVSANNKRVISSTFTGASTRYKDAIDKRLVAAVDIYTSDFGELQIVPTRFMPPTDGAGGASFPVYIIDPDYARVAVLEGARQKPLAETGLSKKRLIWQELGLQVDNEKAHGVLADSSGQAA